MFNRYHGDQFIVKETVELFECPDCGFRFDAIHTQDDEHGGYVCPNCHNEEVSKFLSLITENQDYLFTLYSALTYETQYDAAILQDIVKKACELQKVVSADA
jgi:predicted RNA-binding Zn-ribbon protein involved in translation (DUF1610 family)